MCGGTRGIIEQHLARLKDNKQTPALQGIPLPLPQQGGQTAPPGKAPSPEQPGILRESIQKMQTTPAGPRALVSGYRSIQGAYDANQRAVSAGYPVGIDCQVPSEATACKSWGHGHCVQRDSHGASSLPLQSPRPHAPLVCQAHIPTTWEYAY